MGRRSALIERTHKQPGQEARFSWALSIRWAVGTIGSVVQARESDEAAYGFLCRETKDEEIV